MDVVVVVVVVEEETLLLVVRDVGVLAIDVPLLILTTVIGLPHGRMLDNGCVADEGDEWLMMMRLVHAGFFSLPMMCEVRKEREEVPRRRLLPPASTHQSNGLVWRFSLRHHCN
jgi:hypothetical protein